ncbi:MAG: 4Fe-4S dicluster domain-containing protein [candidate division Zixibacteria bacterium]|nr:4Fe-4S dicluster domain-containing protein [candidate division Zixibacteria bacterium]
MKQRLIVTPDLCTGCRTCELACAFAHAVKGKPGRSRIYPLPTGKHEMWTPVVCLHCDDPACAKSCLVDAITRNEETGAMELDNDKCVKCMACVAACPFGCSLHDAQHDLVVKCDLCAGDPVCAHFCPTKALTCRPVVPTRRKAVG